MSTPTAEIKIPPYSKTTPAYEGKEITPCNLILEGGALRSQFTAGVLDFFMEHDLFAQTTIGVSAGGLTGHNYVMGEIGLACYQNLKYINDSRYLSMKNWISTGNVYGRDFAFRQIPLELERYNFSHFRNSPMKLVTVASNIETGESDYHEYTDSLLEMKYLIATSSLPFFSKPVEVDGKLLLDGGTCDSIPIEYSFMTGAEKHIVVLTRDAEYRKEPNSLMPLMRATYRNYPEFLQRIELRHLEYNDQVRNVEGMAKAGYLFLIRPQKPVTIGLMEKNLDVLLDLYLQGYEQAALNWPAIKEYLEL